MADELRLRWGLQPSQTHVTVAIFRGEKIQAQLDLPPESVLQAIRGLAQLRQQMIQPEGSAAADAQVLPDRLANPLWRIKTDPETGGPELVVHHPGLGVLGFVFPRAEAEKLVEQLQAALAQTKPN